MTTESKYPECEKLAAVRPASREIAEFVEWLHDNGMRICWYHEDGDQVQKTTEQLLSEFFEIDMDKVEKERREMLDEIRAQYVGQP